MKVDEFVDENGRRVRRITTKKVVTRNVVNGDVGEPDEEMLVPEEHLEFQINAGVKEGKPVEVQETTDDDGRRITKITRKTLVTKHVTKDGVKTTVSEPVENVKDMPVLVPREPDSDSQPDEIQEYVDEKGRRVKRILRKATVTQTVTIKGQPVTVQEPEDEVRIMSAEELEPSVEGG